MPTQVQAVVDPPWDLDAWRTLAKRALQQGLPPESIHWGDDTNNRQLLGPVDLQSLGAVADRSISVPKDFMELAARVICHRDTGRFALLYRMLWRIAQGERHLLRLSMDDDVRKAAELEKQVRRDCHKMKAFVRFRKTGASENRFIAWFEPDHWIVDRVSGFFARRFNGMDWTIVTPYRSVRWDGESLAFGAGGTPADAPGDDDSESMWLVYYANIFNPARLNTRMMEKEMPRRYWHNLPEARQLPQLIRNAGARVQQMQDRQAAMPRRRIVPYAPPTKSPADSPGASFDARLAACRNCDLWRPATQVVPGAGPLTAKVMIVGEQPGDIEDLKGRPFVGPSGKLLDRIFDELEIDRSLIYLTNAVKHFHFRPTAKRRIHESPRKQHIDACRPWLELEIERVKPQLIITLGATALQSIAGSQVPLKDVRGQFIKSRDINLFATVHPSWVLRQEKSQQAAAYAELKQDLRLAWQSLDPPEH